MQAEKKQELELIAAKIRKHALEAIKSANSGHIGGSFSIAEILSVLYFDQMHIDPKSPKDEDRDRFVLSKGHCTPAAYSALAMKGFFPIEDLAGFRKIDSYLSGHMEMNGVPGVDMSTGSLGQGLSAGIGMALAAKLDKKNYRTYVILGDGEIEEGQVWEAAMFAGNHGLDNLVAIVDYNKLQLDGSVEEINSPCPIDEKFKAFKWEVIPVDGHDVEQLEEVFQKVETVKGKPVLILADTIKGKGVSIFEGIVKWHGNRPNEEEYRIAFQELNQRIEELEGAKWEK